jgi:hypothetical protein
MTAAPETAKTDELPIYAYARRLRAVHALIAQGKGDTEEAEAIADEMDAPWYAMTKPEQERMGGLSCDLYALAEGGAKQVDMTPQVRNQWEQAAAVADAAFEAGDVDAALAFLRRPSPKGLPRYKIPFLQARCWERLGDADTAQVFMKEAERHGLRKGISFVACLSECWEPSA